MIRNDDEQLAFAINRDEQLVKKEQLGQQC